MDPWNENDTLAEPMMIGNVRENQRPFHKYGKQYHSTDLVQYHGTFFSALSQFSHCFGFQTFSVLASLNRLY
jgi:hypothetical protein